MGWCPTTLQLSWALWLSKIMWIFKVMFNQVTCYIIHLLHTFFFSVLSLSFCFVTYYCVICYFLCFRILCADSTMVFLVWTLSGCQFYEIVNLKCQAVQMCDMRPIWLISTSLQVKFAKRLGSSIAWLTPPCEHCDSLQWKILPNCDKIQANLAKDIVPIILIINGSNNQFWNYASEFSMNIFYKSCLLFSRTVWLKNLGKFRICSFGIGCWIRWATKALTK